MILDYFDTQIGTVLACGNQIRQALVVACSEAEQDTTGAKATRLKALLDEASTYLATLDDVTAPTVSSRTQAFGVPTIVITCSEGLDADRVPPISAFAITSPARTVTAVRVQGTQIQVDYSGVTLVTADTPDIAYTQPADTTEAVCDMGGNLLASFVASAVTVAAS